MTDRRKCLFKGYAAVLTSAAVQIFPQVVQRATGCATEQSAKAGRMGLGPVIGEAFGRPKSPWTSTR
ncbi:hypothetical protein [Streptomyces flaveus]|uniref:hypothetical protein n=1 Tax=Streptomyces flaveus TaxID=66370 RepID=UPI003332C143